MKMLLETSMLPGQQTSKWSLRMRYIYIHVQVLVVQVPLVMAG